jgi:hypothetical protein
MHVAITKIGRKLNFMPIEETLKNNAKLIMNAAEDQTLTLYNIFKYHNKTLNATVSDIQPIFDSEIDAIYIIHI